MVSEIESYKSCRLILCSAGSDINPPVILNSDSRRTLVGHGSASSIFSIFKLQFVHRFSCLDRTSPNFFASRVAGGKESGNQLCDHDSDKMSYRQRTDPPLRTTEWQSLPYFAVSRLLLFGEVKARRGLDRTDAISEAKRLKFLGSVASRCPQEDEVW